MSQHLGPALFGHSLLLEARPLSCFHPARLSDPIRIMPKTILLQLDTDPLPSVFDRVVAVDAGVDELFSYGGVTPANVTSLVHGAMFTRGPADLKSTAIFVGGSNVAAGEELLTAVRNTFFGPVHVSTMMDSNGSNTTAAAAVLAARRHLDLSTTTAVILGGTGPVGFRAAQLLLSEGAKVRLVSRSINKAAEATTKLQGLVPGCDATPFGLTASGVSKEVLDGAELIIAAGAAGVTFLTAASWQGLPSLKVAIDVNAVPPLGLEGISVMDKNVMHGQVICYGAIGIGGTKMRIHKAAVTRLFSSNALNLDTDEIYLLGKELA